MRRRQPRTGGGRAIIGLVALYALLLQAFLGLATPSRALDGPGEVLCAGHSSGEPASKSVHVHACCTVVQAGTLTLPHRSGGGGLALRADLAVCVAPGSRDPDDGTSGL